jgi:peroxiredoxin
METATELAGSGGLAQRRPGRLTTIVVMAVTAAIIMVVAVLVNQPKTVVGGVTQVDLSGNATGAAPEVGKAAPDFTALMVDGTSITLSDLKGKPVWLTFGASWCQPCRAENPDIQAALDKHAGSDLVIIGVFISEDAATVKDYADRVGLTYHKIADPSTAIAVEYRIVGIPSHFFIDRDGVLRQLRIGSLDPAAMETALEAILE